MRSIVSCVLVLMISLVNPYIAYAVTPKMPSVSANELVHSYLEGQLNEQQIVELLYRWGIRKSESDVKDFLTEIENFRGSPQQGHMLGNLSVMLNEVEASREETIVVFDNVLSGRNTPRAGARHLLFKSKNPAYSIAVVQRVVRESTFDTVQSERVLALDAAIRDQNLKGSYTDQFIENLPFILAGVGGIIGFALPMAAISQIPLKGSALGPALPGCSSFLLGLATLAAGTFGGAWLGLKVGDTIKARYIPRKKLDINPLSFDPAIDTN